MTNQNNRTGSQTRRAKRNLEPNSFTRAQACKLIAGTTDLGLIESFKSHPSEGVKRYVAHKLFDLIHKPYLNTKPAKKTRKPMTAEQREAKNLKARERRAAQKAA